MLPFAQWSYIQTIPLSGDLKTDITDLLTENGKPETAAHCMAVAKTGEKIAAQFGLDQSVVSAAALLHDVSNIVKPQDMLDYAISQNWELDEAEKQHPFLLHQRLSAVFAKEMFNIRDTAILSAIECHSTLKAAPSAYDMALFLADKLSWDSQGTPPFSNIVSSAFAHSLEYASLTYIHFVLNEGLILSPHKWLMDAKNFLEDIC